MHIKILFQLLIALTEVRLNNYSSFDLGPVHFIMLSSEYYCFKMYKEANDMWNWLEEDLKKVRKLIFVNHKLHERQTHIITYRSLPSFPRYISSQSTSQLNYNFPSYKRILSKFYLNSPRILPELRCNFKNAQ